MKYRKKPVVVEAFRFGYDDMPERFLDADRHSGDVFDNCVLIETFEFKGTVVARKGDWIICGVDGEIYPCKHSIFVKTYEPVE